MTHVGTNAALINTAGCCAVSTRLPTARRRLRYHRLARRRCPMDIRDTLAGELCR